VSHGLARQWDAERPVSVSPNALRILRERVPQTLLISDDLQMQGLRKMMTLDAACRSGLEAGLDLLLIGNNLLDEQLAMAGLAAGMEQYLAGNPSTEALHARSLTRIHSRKRQFAGLTA
jgi:beta-N-acetylhexosaminidase